MTKALASKKRLFVRSNQICEHVTEHCACCWVPAARTESCALEIAGVECVCLCSDSRFRANHGEDYELTRKKICDFVLFCEADSDQIVLPCEMKGARPNIEHVRQQLQTGADIAEYVLTDFPTPRFVGLLVSKKLLKPEARKRLGEVNISFRGSDYPIRWLKCGSEVAPLLKDK